MKRAAARCCADALARVLPSRTELTMRYLSLFLLFACLLPACSDNNNDKPALDDNNNDKEEARTCDHLYGLPTSNTGLTDEQCKPIIDLPGMEYFKEPEYSEEDVQKLEDAVLLTDMTKFYHITEDPYPSQEDYFGKHKETAVCAFIVTEDGYDLDTYDDDASALAAGAQITHYGPCGLCSSMQDLAVYIREPDLTAPVRSCGIKGGLGEPTAESEQKTRECLQDIGFSDPCIDIWYWDIENTKAECFDLCAPLLTAKHHDARNDYKLNACVQCDEDKSGPLFKVMAGRTRRNSGLSSALCRPCETVQPMDHTKYDWTVD